MATMHIYEQSACASATKASGVVNVAADDLAIALNRLEGAASEIASKLYPALRPQLDEKAGEIGSPAYSVPLAFTLQTFGQRVSNLDDLLRDLLSRLEI